MMEGQNKQSYYSHGKLLITAEYLVLDGAEALAVPTKRGQWLHVEQVENSAAIIWKSLDDRGECWMEVNFDHELNVLNNNINDKAELLQKLLKKAREINPSFLTGSNSYKVTSQLEFPTNWGLGSSSTLVSNIASWSETNPFALQFGVFGGSGYDVACAQNEYPLLYSLKEKKPNFNQVIFSPSFQDRLFLIHLGEKQNSRNEIKRYRSLKAIDKNDVRKVSELTNELIRCVDADQFKILIERHEQLISKSIGMKTIKEQRFDDYPGVIKSLGAWGGDFILSIGGKKEREYFLNKGYDTVLAYSDVVLGDQ